MRRAAFDTVYQTFDHELLPAGPRLVPAIPTSTRTEGDPTAWASWDDWTEEPRDWIIDLHGVGPRGGFTLGLTVRPWVVDGLAALQILRLVARFGGGEVRAAGGRALFGAAEGRVGAPDVVLPLHLRDPRVAGAALLGFRLAPRGHRASGRVLVATDLPLAWVDGGDVDYAAIESTAVWSCGRLERVEWRAHGAIGVIKGVMRPAGRGGA